MQIIRKSDLIRYVSVIYKKQYFHNNKWDECYFGKFKDHEQQYSALLKATTDNEVQEIIGNSGWTRNKCNECNGDFEVTIQVGEEPFYDSATVNLCIDCLSKAHKEMILHGGWDGLLSVSRQGD